MVTQESLWEEYQRGLSFKEGLGLFETVRNNENFYIGKQWEGVQAGGLPTPVFNFIRRIVLYLVASTAADRIKLNATPLGGGEEAEELCRVVNGQFERLFEDNRVGLLVREFTRNAAVDGDGCLYSYFDPDYDGGGGLGGIRTELVENTRVFFGNPNDRRVEGQPYLILSRRETVDKLSRRAAAYGGEGEILPDGEDELEAPQPGQRRCTVLHRFWKEEKTGTVWACECTRTAVVRPPWDTRQKRYPIVWLPWDYVQDCYHGQAAVTGLIPNQIFVNKLFAMTMLSLMTTAYPKVIYDKSRIGRWDARVGTAIGVSGGDMGSVARTLDPAAISPQVPQFIQLAISLTKEFMGATDAALGTVRPDNTSAILALQKASGVPMELFRQNLYQCLEDLGRIWLDIMRLHCGKRWMTQGEEKRGFDFGALERFPVALKLDVGGSAYWSEIAQLNTLDNLLAGGKIDVVDYLERIPNGYIADQAGLIETLKARREGRSLPQAREAENTAPEAEEKEDEDGKGERT